MEASCLSVVIPTHNRADLLGDTIASVLGQTLPVRECVVVDDGSGDHTERVVRGFGGRVRYVRQPNQGKQVARNAGIAASTAPWIAFLDDDDLWLPGRHASLRPLLDDPAVDVVAGNFRKFRGDRLDGTTHFERQPANLWDGFAWDADRRFGRIERLPFERLFPHHPFWPSSLAVRRTLLDRVGGWDPRMRPFRAEDFEFVARVLRAGRLGVAWEATMHYREHPGNAAGDGRKVIVGLHWIWHFIREHHPLTAAEAAFLERQLQATAHEAHWAAFAIDDGHSVRALARQIGWRDLSRAERAKTMLVRLPRPLREAVRRLVA